MGRSHLCVSSASSGKAGRLAVRPDVTLAPATVRGQATGPARSGHVTLLDRTADRGVYRLLRPGGPLFWSHLLYRIRGHRMHLYKIRLTGLDSTGHHDEAASQTTVHHPRGRPTDRQSTARAASHGEVAADQPPRSATLATADPTTTQLYRAVHLTARTSALLFAASQATAALDSGARQASRPLYIGFMAAHAVHFALVARYAQVSGGHNLFPGGCSMAQVGGWRTVLAIFTMFAGLAATGLVRRSAPKRPRRPAVCPAEQPPRSSPRCTSGSTSARSNDPGGTRYSPRSLRERPPRTSWSSIEFNTRTGRRRQRFERRRTDTAPPPA